MLHLPKHAKHVNTKLDDGVCPGILWLVNMRESMHLLHLVTVYVLDTVR